MYRQKTQREQRKRGNPSSRDVKSLHNLFDDFFQFNRNVENLDSSLFNEPMSELARNAGRIQLNKILQLKNIWNEIVGEKMDKVTVPYRINKSVLYISVYDSMWLAEVSYFKADIISRLNALDIKIDDIRFTLSKSKTPPLPPKATVKEVSEEQMAWLDSVTQKITNEKMRITCYNTILAYLKYGK